MTKSSSCLRSCHPEASDLGWMEKTTSSTWTHRPILFVRQCGTPGRKISARWADALAKRIALYLLLIDTGIKANWPSLCSIILAIIKIWLRVEGSKTSARMPTDWTYWSTVASQGTIMLSSRMSNLSSLKTTTGLALNSDTNLMVNDFRLVNSSSKILSISRAKC